MFSISYKNGSAGEILSCILICTHKGLNILLRKDKISVHVSYYVCHYFQEWVVLGSLDLDVFVEENLKDLTDWERNFKALKLRGRDAEKLPRYRTYLQNNCN